jgi:hypothetical protein
MSCAICWEPLDDPTGRWQCEHRDFHAVCAQHCTTCPLCRAPERATARCTLRLGQTYGHSVTLDGRYAWPMCTAHPEREHHVVFSKPYGVVGWCQTCERIRTYNWQG